MNELQKYAQVLVDKGLSVIPVVGKNPGINGPGWQKLRGSSIFEGKYLKNWGRASGLGVITGEASGIICLDIDIENSMENLRPLLTELITMLPGPECSFMGKKVRPPSRLFRYNNENSYNFTNIKIDLLSDGKQKLMPPSMHVDGYPYEWVQNPIDIISVDDLPTLPSEVLNYLILKNDELKMESDKLGIRASLVSVLGRCRSGSHEHMSKRGVHLFRQGFTFEDIVDELLEYDKEINSNEDARYFACPSRQWKSQEDRVNAMTFVGEIIKNHAHKRLDENYFKEEINNGFTKIIKKPNAKPDDPGKPVRQHISLYNFLKSKKDCWYCPEIKSFQIYDGKRYVSKPEDYIKKFAQDRFKKPSCISIGDKATFLDYAKHAQQTSINDFVLSDKGLINLRNGTFDIYAKQLRKHNRKDRLTNLIDIDLKDDTDAPIWETLLDLVTMARPHMNTAIEEFIGYALSGCSYQRFNKLLILDGGGSNGKSTLIRVIKDLIGYDNSSAVSLTAITKERFAGFSLVNKLINFCSEEPKEAFANTGAIKQLTGGDPIMVEEKHKGAFLYNNIAKLIISYNRMPFFPDSSSGMVRRIMLIPCERNFELNPDIKINDPEGRIKKLEQPQVLRRCVNAYLKVLERGHFTDVPEGLARVEQMIIESDSVLKFIDERLILTNSDADHVTNEKVWEIFMDFHGGKGKFTKDGFFKKLSEHLRPHRSAESAPVRDGQKSVRVRQGVRFKDGIGDVTH